MNQLELPSESRVRLWVYDEMRYGLHPLTRKMWCLRGSARHRDAATRTATCMEPWKWQASRAVSFC